MRRVLSIILYLVAGLCLASGSLMAFAEVPGANKLSLFRDFGPWVVVPLALGAFASPGRRIAEVGIVIMVAAALVAFPMAVMAMPGAEQEFTPEMQRLLGAQKVGWTFLAILAGWGALIWGCGRFWQTD